jgi:hypothetical protein
MCIKKAVQEEILLQTGNDFGYTPLDAVDQEDEDEDDDLDNLDDDDDKGSVKNGSSPFLKLGYS